MAHIHSVYDTDAHFSINPTTRVLKNEASGKTCVIQHDHNSERFTFEIPRYIDGHDMSTCNVVQIHYLNINPQTKEQKAGVYVVDDLQISPEGDEVVILSWLISGNATQLVGSLNFLIRFACVTNDNVDYAWNTAVYTGISVSSGIYNGNTVVEEYADILAQWEARITALEEGGTGGGSVDLTGYVKTINGQAPDENGNVEITIPDSGQNGNQIGGYYQNYAKFKAVFLGDSQTDDTVGEPKKWWKWVGELLNIGECVSYGKSGSTLCGTGATTMCSRYAIMDDDATMVFVMGGVNDLKTTTSSPLGAVADTTPETIYGAIRYLCRELQKKYPKVPIIFITPTNQANGFFVHNDGLTTYDIARAMKEVCGQEGVLCLDAQSSLGINPAVNRTTHTTDGLHLNYDANELLGKWVARQVNIHVPILPGMESDGGEVEPDEPTTPDNTGKTLSSISVVYSGGDVTAGTVVSELTGIVVTAHYSDGTNEAVTGYALSGTIAEGENTITVNYDGKTTTFTVVGVTESAPVEIPTEHNGWSVTRFAELPSDISAMYQYPGFINGSGNYNSNVGYSHMGYIACEAGTYTIVPYIGYPVSVYDSDFNWIETKEITTNGVGFDLVLSDFRYLILATDKSKGYTSITKKA